MAFNTALTCFLPGAIDLEFKAVAFRLDRGLEARRIGPFELCFDRLRRFALRVDATAREIDLVIAGRDAVAGLVGIQREGAIGLDLADAAAAATFEIDFRAGEAVDWLARLIGDF